METDNPSVTVVARFNPASAEQRITFSMSNIDFRNRASGTVIFTLNVKTVLEVRFPSNPIQWVDTNLLPINPPPGATVTRVDDNNTMVMVEPDPNIKEKQKFRFYVIVQSTDGRFFGTDPTIVTMPPDQP